MNYLKLITCALFINICFGQLKTAENCASKSKCGECIRNSECSWHITTVDGKDHCKFSKDSGSGKNIINPENKLEIKEHASDHLEPKSVLLKIRPGTKETLKFTYTHKVDYPVDMYFLMDMSKSMQYFRNQIAIMASDLVLKMKEKTKDVQIGFGSFVDKTSLPYVKVISSNIIEKPCEECEIPYSFKNHLKLTDDINEFSHKVNNTPISANVDGPEGTLEALLQAIVCTKEIGWRPNARHIIILTTDDAFHIAGDGKLAGIVEPNDGECHLENNVYTHGLLHDYPSVGQLRERASNKSMNILFVVTKQQEKLYSKLQENIKNSYLDTLQENSDNIVNLVIQFYENITSSIKIDNSFPQDNFDVEIDHKTSSDSPNGEWAVSNNEKYEFSANIVLKKCPDSKFYTESYHIKPSGLAEQINIQVEMLCDCPCEHPGNEDYVKDSDQCSNNGDLQCGICECHKGKMGDKCQCDTYVNTLLYSDDSLLCRKANSTEDCSGKGHCKCGQCQCVPPYSGAYCECNNELCVTNKDKNEICSNNGNCDCGKCICSNDWTGKKCDCTTSKESCILPGSLEICSNKGKCQCGKCECYDKEKYGGKYCDDCKTCPKECKDFENCVKCHYNPEKVECEAKCDKFTINETLDANNTENLCNYQNEENCLVTFLFDYNKIDRSAEIYSQITCTPSQAGIYSTISIIAAIVFAFLLAILIWKAVTYFTDRREYQKFETEAKEAKWNVEQNPLFKKATSEFQNPLFRKSD